MLLYELAAGVHPFGAGVSSGGAADAAGMVAAGDVLARIVAEDPPPLETRSVLPPAAVAIVARALARNPDARFADGRELAEALRALPAPALTPLPFGAPRGRRAGDLGRARSCASRSGGGWPTRRAMAAFFTLVLVPAWMLWRDVEPKPLRVALRVILLFSVAAGVSVRLHLWFVARYRVGALARERRVARPWLVATNVAFVGALAVSASVLLDTHAATASVFFGLAVVHAVVSVMVEPATNRAFTVPRMRYEPPAGCAASMRYRLGRRTCASTTIPPTAPNWSCAKRRRRSTPPHRGGRGMLTGVLMLAVLAAAVALGLLRPRLVEPRAASHRRRPGRAAAAGAAVPEGFGPVPQLDASDDFVRALIRQLSQKPEWAAWLASATWSARSWCRSTRLRSGRARPRS